MVGTGRIGVGLLEHKLSYYIVKHNNWFNFEDFKIIF
jgi:hypothetical protein